MAEAVIRKAVPGDALAIARIKVEGWRHAYSSFMLAETLAQLDAHVHGERWKDQLENESDQATFVSVHQGEVTGFAASGPNRHGPEGYTSELYAIYIDPPYTGGGIGSKLTLACAESMRALGHANMSVYCFGQNELARKYYEGKGAVLHNTSIYTIDGVDYPDCCYVWESLEELIQRLQR